MVEISRARKRECHWSIQQLDKIAKLRYGRTTPLFTSKAYLNVHPATDHTIHQKTNFDHATDVTSFITVEKNVTCETSLGRRNI